MPGFFPEFYPDETLYSIISRYIFLLRPSSYVETYKELFGFPESRWSIAGVPTGFNILMKNLPAGHGYNEEKLLINHSLVSYYRPFLSKERIEMMKDKNRSSFATGFRFMHHETFRYCPVCIEQDKKTYGEPYWHRIHQVPGVMVCPMHEVLIEDSPLASYDSIRNTTLSEYIEINPLPKPKLTKNKKIHNLLLTIAIDSQWILSNHPSDTDNFYNKVRLLLKSSDWYSKRGDIFHISSFIEAFTQYYTNDFLKMMNSSILDAKKYNWVRVLAFKHGSIHPLRYLLLFRFLGYSAESFFNSNEFVPTSKKIIPTYKQQFGSGPWPCRNKASDHYEKNTINDCKIKVKLYQGTKAPIGIFECPLCGYTYKYKSTTPNQVRVEKYGPIWENRLMELCNSSKSWRSISKDLGVFRNTAKEQATKILSKSENNSQSINEQKKEDMFKERRKKYRQIWLKMRSEFPIAKTSELSKMEPSAARWLSMNDADWFKQHNPIYMKSSSPINWGKRDIKFKIKASEAVQDILNYPGYPVKITMYAIFEKIGMIVNKPFRHKLPQTMQYIQSVTETDESFRIRRIMWVAKQFIKDGKNATRLMLLDQASIHNQFRYSNSINKAVDEALLMIESSLNNYQL